MEVTQDQIIGMILNVLGYLSAGALWTVIYSFFRDRRRAGITASIAAPVPEREESRFEIAPSRGKSRLEFVNFNSSGENRSRFHNEAGLEDDPRPDSGRRNRSEVIRLAREMLKSKTSNEKIKQTLPITDGELAMINNGVKHG